MWVRRPLNIAKKLFFQKTVVITNSGKKTIPFKLLTSNLWFHYDYNPRCPLAPGMNAKLAITFKCTSMEDKYELISLMTTENRKTNILVVAVNASPILHCEYNIILKIKHFLRRYFVFFFYSPRFSATVQCSYFNIAK